MRQGKTLGVNWNPRSFPAAALLLTVALAAPLRAAPGLRSESGSSASATADSEKLQHLPVQIQQVYGQTPSPVRQLLCEEIKGQTVLVPGVLTVNHKTAFIRGRAVGKNVFDFMRGHVEKMIAQGKMSPDFGPHVHRFFEAARGLTPDQRAVLVDILNAESGP